MTLRTLLTCGASVLGFAGLLAAAALVWATTLLNGVTTQLGESIESVRAAEELEVSLLLHERGPRPIDSASATREGLQRDGQAVLKWLGRVERHVGSEEERALVERVRRESEEYLQTKGDTRAARLGSAVLSAEALSRLNVDQARVARARAEKIDWLANVIGVTTSALLLAGIGIVIVAARTRVYRPLIALRDALSEYKRGNTGHRVEERGPEELREIASEFNSMAGVLADQRESQLRFVAGVAHDLKNPLNALKLSASLLARGERFGLEDKPRQLLERIAKQAERLNRMVEDLLDRTRIESGALDLRPEDCDLRELAAEVVEVHKLTAAAHLLELGVPPEPVWVRCDPGRMSQVLTNLVNNAIKYSPNGGCVRINVGEDEGRAYVTVSDEGVGIAEDEWEGIFEPFRRSESTKNEIPGIGLGLSVSRRIARAHGGDILLKSTVGAGTTFRVELPRHQVDTTVHRSPVSQEGQRSVPPAE